VIFNRLWESVRAGADAPLVKQLDCQFQLVQAIHINETGFHKLTTGELVKAIQSQIDDQLSKLAATGTPLCQTSLTLEVIGKPDMHCFVDAPHGKRIADQVKDITLDKTLSGLVSTVDTTWRISATTFWRLLLLLKSRMTFK